MLITFQRIKLFYSCNIIPVDKILTLRAVSFSLANNLAKLFLFSFGRHAYNVNNMKHTRLIINEHFIGHPKPIDKSLVSSEFSEKLKNQNTLQNFFVYECYL